MEHTTELSAYERDTQRHADLHTRTPDELVWVHDGLDEDGCALDTGKVVLRRWDNVHITTLVVADCPHIHLRHYEELCEKLVVPVKVLNEDCTEYETAVPKPQEVNHASWDDPDALPF
jgi:hypothetical protein